MNAALPLVLALCLPLTGCIDETPPEADVGPGVTPPAFTETHLVEVLYYAFQIDSTAGNGTIDLEIPPGSLATYLSVVFLNGAHRNAAFTLGECQGISPFYGTGVSAGGIVNAGDGQSDRAALHECGDIPDGPQAISWTIEAGTIQGRLMVYAAVPE